MEQKKLKGHFQLGGYESFEELYRLYYKKALGTAYLIGGRKNIAEDIVQEAFVICHQHFSQLKNPEMFYIWFYRILVRVGWRMAKREKSCLPLDDLYVEKAIDTNLNDRESHFDEINDRLLVRESIRKLNQPLIILYYFNELTIKEISKILDCFQGTVKSRLFKARKLLERKLGSKLKSDSNLSEKGLKLNEE